MNKDMPKGRNAYAQAACFKKAGSMPHRNTPRGGARNDFRDDLYTYTEDNEILREIENIQTDE